ncbi:OmpH family outer membrane protein [Paracoccus sp. (in: a-proteobacteria)]|uniref:OmpH family outer membrane protein n=1 Tax=Paracoccus sp. TaxID=267 RepID=UPI00396CD82C
MIRTASVLGLLLSLALPAGAQQGGDALSPDIPGIEPVPPAVPLPNNTIASPGAVQASPLLTLDQDTLYLSSEWGKRLQAQLEEEGEVIAAENERLTELLSAEEAQLTEQRATLDAAEFRRMAESFDIRATEIRRERAQAVQDLNAWADADRAAFFRAALPVMGQVMQERGAVAVLDRRTVFVSLDVIDVTDDLIEALNERVGDGAGAVALPEAKETMPSGQSGDPVAEQGE